MGRASRDFPHFRWRKPPSAKPTPKRTVAKRYRKHAALRREAALLAEADAEVSAWADRDNQQQAFNNSRAWWKQDGALARYRCIVCRGVHCHWCGLPFFLRWVSIESDIAPTIEHLYPKEQRHTKEAMERGLTVAHRICNTTRGHSQWLTPHHPGERSRLQQWATMRVEHALSMMLKMHPEEHPYVAR